MTDKTDARLSALTRLYNAGYKSGHHYTVEGGYTDVTYADADTYHREEVEEILADSDYEALAAPAEGAQRECKHEWRSGDNSIVQRAVFCIHCREIRTAKAAGSNEPLIDSAGGAMGECIGSADGKHSEDDDGRTPGWCEHCSSQITPQPFDGDGAVVSHHTARVMLDSLDDYARMDAGVDAHGPRETLERYIAQQEARPAATAVPAGFYRVRDSIRGSVIVNKLFPGDEVIETFDTAPAAPKGGVVDEAMVFKAADALVGRWNLHYADAERMASCVLKAAAPATGEQS